MITVRKHHAPIITPHLNESWRSSATFNPSPSLLNGKLVLWYRALSAPDPVRNNHSFSSIGVATLDQGGHVTESHQAFFGARNFDHAGCEDPRATVMNGNTYIFYTGLTHMPPQADGIRVAVAITRDGKIFEHHAVTPFNAKAMTLFPEKINGKYTVIFTLHPDTPPAHIAIAQSENITDFWKPDFWNQWYKNHEQHLLPDLRRSMQDHTEIGATPILTNKGWLLIYSHISNYFDEGGRVFGIEALLLDKQNPKQIIGRTRGPFMVPEEFFERFGVVSNVIFPSGAWVADDTLRIFYGGGDTVCCVADTSLSELLEIMTTTTDELFVRSQKNPIISPIENHDWENYSVFNPAAFEHNGIINIVYRAMSKQNTSTLGLATTRDGMTIDRRLDTPIYTPRTPLEEKRNQPAGYSGCEDPRIVVMKNRIYMCYTAYNGTEPPCVALSSISLTDFESHNWSQWSLPVQLTPAEVDDKDGTLFPEPIQGKIGFIHRISHHVCLDFFDSLDTSDTHATRCIELLGPRRGLWDSAKVGVSCPPIKTKSGDWLLLYHGVSDDSIYRVGAALLDKDNPTVVLGRSMYPLFEPKTEYELHGQVSRVVFPCGAIVRNDTIFLYYGGGDSVVGVATGSLQKILDSLQ